MEKPLSEYLELSEKIVPNSHDRQIKIGFLSSFTISGLPEVMKIKCDQLKISAQTHLGEYNQYNQDILDSNSQLYKFQPDITFLILDIRSLLGDFFYFPYRTSQEEKKKLIDEKIQELINLASIFSKNSSSKLIISNIHIPFFSPYGIAESDSKFGYHDAILYFNKRLKEKIQEFDSVYIFDFNGFITKYGEDNVFDYQNYFFGDIKVSLNYIPYLAEHLMSYIIGYLGITKKCIVLDLDNTLWGGIVGEDGFDGIQIGPQPPGNSFVEFQKHLKALSQRGLILAINSKNNLDDAMNVIENHPHMVLKKDDFSCIVINWGDKVQNMHEIAKQLNISLDSFVFFDDDALNREYVRRELPQVHVPEISSDPSEYARILLSLNDFSTLQITAEDISRKKMYKEQEQRVELQNSSSNLTDFLKTLDLHVVIKKANNFTIPRISQLTLKTNQFNLTTKRYQKDEIEKFSDDENMLVGSAQIIDKFGDNGITGVFIIRKEEPKEWILDSFLLSCRVMGRQVENSIINYIFDQAKKNKIERIKAQFIPTEKNSPIQDFLPSCGFQKEGDFWIYPVEKPFKSPDFVSVEVDDV
jgi:FkbH-like protein